MLVCDTGPLVAAALRRDPDHRACVDLFTGLHLAGRQIVIPAPVVAEVGYLLAAKAGPQAEATFLRSLAGGDFVVEALTRDDYARMADLVEQYGDLPLGTTDAAVVAVAERLDCAEVATLDRRDFTVVLSTSGRSPHCSDPRRPAVSDGGLADHRAGGGAAIARALDTDGTPRPNGGIRWYPTTIARLIDREAQNASA